MKAPAWPLPLEKDVQAQVVSLFKTAGLAVFSTSQYRASHVSIGFPDLVWFDRRGRRHGYFEVKRPQRAGYHPHQPETWKPEPLRLEQALFRDLCRATDTLHSWGGFPEAQEMLVSLGYGRILRPGIFEFDIRTTRGLGGAA